MKTRDLNARWGTKNDETARKRDAVCIISSPTTSSVPGIPSSSRGWISCGTKRRRAFFFALFFSFFHRSFIPIPFFQLLLAMNRAPQMWTYSPRSAYNKCSRLPAEAKGVIIIYCLSSVWSLTISIPMAHSCQICTQAIFWRHMRPPWVIEEWFAWIEALSWRKR